MDQIKIGEFIAECRKKQNLTQGQLAEKLGELKKNRWVIILFSRGTNRF